LRILPVVIDVASLRRNLLRRRMNGSGGRMKNYARHVDVPGFLVITQPYLEFSDLTFQTDIFRDQPFHLGFQASRASLQLLVRRCQPGNFGLGFAIFVFETLDLVLRRGDLDCGGLQDGNVGDGDLYLGYARSHVPLLELQDA
jgi:hypothetical protein